MFNHRHFENSAGGGVAVLEVMPAGQDEPPPQQFVPLKRTELRGEIMGPLAALRVTHEYSFSAEECALTLEAAYRFPLPGDAAVTGVRVRFGDVEIAAELKARKQAEQEYALARQENRQAALLTRESPDLFTLLVSGIQPGQPVTVETCYVQCCRAESGGFSLRVPLTAVPRYVRSDELDSRHAHGQPLAVVRDPGHRFALELAVHGAGAIHSATHDLAVSRQDGVARIALQAGEVIPDRDFVLAWAPGGAPGGAPGETPDRPHLQAWAHDDPAGGQAYFLALVSPPAAPPANPPMAREVILMVDHSGSMGGAKWRAADWAVKAFLAGLQPADRFNLCLFHSQAFWLSNALQAGSAEAVAAAVQFLESHRDSGGTELGVALEQALGLARAGGALARHVLIVTDAEVTDAGRILRLVDREAKLANRRRISLLCIDAAPNSFLAVNLAERGGGVARFLTSDPAEGDIATALDEVLQDWSQPVLAGARLEVDQPRALASRPPAEGERGWSAIDLGDLPAGRPVWVAGRVPRPPDGAPLRLRLRSGRHTLAEAAVDTAAGGDHPALKPLFGAGRILELEFLAASGQPMRDVAARLTRLGYDSNAVLKGAEGQTTVYAENARRQSEGALRGLLIRESLAYGLACSETAFVATRQEAGRPVEGAVVVANALAQGWDSGFMTKGPMLMAAAPAPAMSAPAAPLRAAPAALGDVPNQLAMPSFLSQSAPGQPAPAQPAGHVVFAGRPQFDRGRAVAFDSSRAGQDQDLPASPIVLSGITVSIDPGGSLDPGLYLSIYVDDPARPRARMKLAEVLRQGGSRPLNIARRPGQVVRIVLEDTQPSGAANLPHLSIALAW